MATIDKFIDYIKNNGEERTRVAVDSWTIFLEGEYSVEYKKMNMCDSMWDIEIHSPTYSTTLYKDDVKELENRINKYNTIYDIIDSYAEDKRKLDMKELEEKRKIERLFKGGK